MWVWFMGVANLLSVNFSKAARLHCNRISIMNYSLPYIDQSYFTLSLISLSPLLSLPLSPPSLFSSFSFFLSHLYCKVSSSHTYKGAEERVENTIGGEDWYIINTRLPEELKHTEVASILIKEHNEDRYECTLMIIIIVIKINIFYTTKKINTFT